MAKALRLDEETQAFSIDYNVPYEFSIERESGAIESRAAIQNESGDYITPIVSSEWLRGNDGALVFSNDNQIIQGI